MNRTISSLAVAVTLALAGCDNTLDGGGSDGGGDGGGSTPTTSVTLAGHTLNAKSSVSTRVSKTGTNALTIGISDHPDICSTFDCRIGKPGPAGTYLSLFLYGDFSDYTVSSSAMPGSAFMTFAVVDATGATTFSQLSASGSVKLFEVKEGVSMSGSYEVTMESGAVLKGTFTAPWCSRINRTLVGEGIICTGGSDGGACANSCTCEGRTVSASCSQTGSNTWSCMCRNGSGATSTCTETLSSGNTDACGTYFNCCPFEF